MEEEETHQGQGRRGKDEREEEEGRVKGGERREEERMMMKMLMTEVHWIVHLRFQMIGSWKLVQSFIFLVFKSVHASL